MSEELKPEVAPVEPVAGKLRVEQRILIWLGFYRDHLPVEAITEMQEIATTLAAHPPAAPTDALAEKVARLEEALKQKDAALRLFLALMDDPDYDFGELCEEFVPIARAALAAMQEAKP